MDMATAFAPSAAQGIGWGRRSSVSAVAGGAPLTAGKGQYRLPFDTDAFGMSARRSVRPFGLLGKCGRPRNSCERPLANSISGLAKPHPANEPIL